jgi:xanthine dehydrogenase iron-sulfur cluster and FAD-binding subunit A
VSGKFSGKPTLVFGNISSHQSRASQTEAYLEGKTVNKATLTGAVNVLDGELSPEGHGDPLLPSVAYRKAVAKNLLYKVSKEEKDASPMEKMAFFICIHLHFP